MNYGSIKIADCANGPGLRTSLFVSGCRNHCKGCFNPETWDFDYGQLYSVRTREYILSTLTGSDGLSILGGEPMEPENQFDVFFLAAWAHGIYKKTVWIYTGYTWESLQKMRDNPRSYIGMILKYTDILVDGPFVEAERDISLRFRGSRNQRIIDVPESLKQGRVVLAQEWM